MTRSLGDYQRDDVIDEMIRNTRVIAVAGLSANPERSSHGVAAMLQSHFRIIPVNPNVSAVLGEKSYGRVSDIPATVSVDLVDIFRRSEEVLPIVEDAIAKGARYIWMQQGVVSFEAAELAERHGLQVVMDACLAVEFAKRRTAATAS
ncbi:MAG: CoA-binding protein [Bdellovibrionales bacterium]|nr:CoA-binding protein [Bdellovibrionales bacterium]